MPSWPRVIRAVSLSIGLGIPAAIASSCAWQDRSIVTNHQAASATELAHRQQAVVGEDDGLVAAQRGAIRLPSSMSFTIAPVVLVQGVVLEERARVLRQRIKQHAQAGERLAVQRVRVRRRDHVRPGQVHLGVDAERGPVDRLVAFDHGALVVDQDQVGDLDLAEVHPERVDPEPVGVLGVARGDVPGDALGEAEPAEDAERRRKLLLAVQALLLEGVASRIAGRTGARLLGHRHLDLLCRVAVIVPCYLQ